MEGETNEVELLTYQPLPEEIKDKYHCQYMIWIFFGMVFPGISWLVCLAVFPLKIYWFNIAAFAYPLVLWSIHLGNRRMVQVPLDMGTMVIFLLKTIILMVMMNLQSIDYYFFATLGGVLMLTFAKDIWNKRTGKITNWEEFDEIEDIITEEEREFLQMYRCETLEIEELLYYFVNSGQFGDYESFFYQESDDSDIEFEIMKKNPQKTEETNFEDDFQYLTLAEWNSLLQDIMKDSKFVCSICWEKFFDENELKDFVFLNPPERENALNDNEDEI